MILLILCVCAIDGISLPSSLPRCYRDDPLIVDCITKTAYTLKPSLRSNGIEELEIPPLDHVTIKNVTAGASADNIDIKVTYHNMTFENLDKFELSGIEFMPEEILLKGEIRYEMVPVAVYFNSTDTIEGGLITGDRGFKGYMRNVRGVFVVQGGILEKDGLDYCTVSSVNFALHIDQFNGTVIGSISESFNVTSECVGTWTH
ncbi:uncharacterized protein LOC116171799 [Photinus pyralis]|uniref:uncharacterized protein LOC116171799 n=1 Tax=Photinus pyralis TaxID=7054 RepID=UPI001267002E|nr:uncharacterized protein LOC116171799 [Photinus pyralis]